MQKPSLTFVKFCLACFLWLFDVGRVTSHFNIKGLTVWSDTAKKLSHI